MELKLAAEKQHVYDISNSMGHTEAFRLMMKEKESLIAERYKLNDTVNILKKQAKTDEEKWNSQKIVLEKIIEDKTKAYEDLKAVRDKLQNEMSTVKVHIPSVVRLKQRDAIRRLNH